MNRQRIIDEINAKAATTAFELWRIGLTHAPNERKQYLQDSEKESVTYWTQWEADSLIEAQDIVSFFINEKGMKDVADDDMSPWKKTFVYIF